jgi:hypothetical protein
MTHPNRAPYLDRLTDAALDGEPLPQPSNDNERETFQRFHQTQAIFASFSPLPMPDGWRAAVWQRIDAASMSADAADDDFDAIDISAIDINALGAGPFHPDPHLDSRASTHTVNGEASADTEAAPEAAPEGADLSADAPATSAEAALQPHNVIPFQRPARATAAAPPAIGRGASASQRWRGPLLSTLALAAACVLVILISPRHTQDPTPTLSAPSGQTISVDQPVQASPPVEGLPPEEAARARSAPTTRGQGAATDDTLRSADAPTNAPTPEQPDAAFFADQAKRERNSKSSGRAMLQGAAPSGADGQAAGLDQRAAPLADDPADTFDKAQNQAIGGAPKRPLIDEGGLSPTIAEQEKSIALDWNVNATPPAAPPAVIPPAFGGKDLAKASEQAIASDQKNKHADLLAANPAATPPREQTTSPPPSPSGYVETAEEKQSDLRPTDGKPFDLGGIGGGGGDRRVDVAATELDDVDTATLSVSDAEASKKAGDNEGVEAARLEALKRSDTALNARADGVVANSADRAFGSASGDELDNDDDANRDAADSGRYRAALAQRYYIRDEATSGMFEVALDATQRRKETYKDTKKEASPAKPMSQTKADATPTTTTTADPAPKGASPIVEVAAVAPAVASVGEPAPKLVAKPADGGGVASPPVDLLLLSDGSLSLSDSDLRALTADLTTRAPSPIDLRVSALTVDALSADAWRAQSVEGEGRVLVVLPSVEAAGLLERVKAQGVRVIWLGAAAKGDADGEGKATAEGVDITMSLVEILRALIAR